jgi:hypothetical protein
VNLSSFGRRLLQIADAATFYSITNLFSTANTWTAAQTFSANPSLTGGAISFPATQVASAGANDLDDYEEGTWTPTITASSGTFTTVSGSGRYTKVGRLVTVQVSITITTVGTASGGIVFTLPFTANGSGGWILAGREFNSTGKMLQAIISAGGTTGAVVNYDNTSAIGAGFSHLISGDYWV